MLREIESIYSAVGGSALPSCVVLPSSVGFRPDLKGRGRGIRLAISMESAISIIELVSSRQSEDCRRNVRLV
jgi:hypothetical protein